MTMQRRRFLHLATGAVALPQLREGAMNDPERSSPDRHLDRRTVLKAAAGASAAVLAPRAVSGAVLANNNEIVVLSARAAADYIRLGELSAERYTQALLERYKA